jgi:hypothetical protein
MRPENGRARIWQAIGALGVLAHCSSGDDTSGRGHSSDDAGQDATTDGGVPSDAGLDSSADSDATETGSASDAADGSSDADAADGDDGDAMCYPASQAEASAACTTWKRQRHRLRPGLRRRPQRVRLPRGRRWRCAGPRRLPAPPHRDDARLRPLRVCPRGLLPLRRDACARPKPWRAVGVLHVPQLGRLRRRRCRIDAFVASVATSLSDVARRRGAGPGTDGSVLLPYLTRGRQMREPVRAGTH